MRREIRSGQEFKETFAYDALNRVTKVSTLLPGQRAIARAVGYSKSRVNEVLQDLAAMGRMDHPRANAARDGRSARLKN